MGDSTTNFMRGEEFKARVNGVIVSAVDWLEDGGLSMRTAPLKPEHIPPLPLAR